MVRLTAEKTMYQNGTEICLQKTIYVLCQNNVPISEGDKPAETIVNTEKKKT